jgi:hypothetical protein
LVPQQNVCRAIEKAKAVPQSAEWGRKHEPMEKRGRLSLKMNPEDLMPQSFTAVGVRVRTSGWVAKSAKMKGQPPS